MLKTVTQDNEHTVKCLKAQVQEARDVAISMLPILEGVIEIAK